MSFLGGAEVTTEHAVRETRNDGIERHVPTKDVFREREVNYIDNLHFYQDNHKRY